MPRKDGTATAAEQRDARRVESNRRFIAAMTDDELAEAEDRYHFGPESDVAGQVIAERVARRALRLILDRAVADPRILAARNGLDLEAIDINLVAEAVCDAYLALTGEALDFDEPGVQTFNASTIATERLFMDR